MSSEARPSTGTGGARRPVQASSGPPTPGSQDAERQADAERHRRNQAAREAKADQARAKAGRQENRQWPEVPHTHVLVEGTDVAINFDDQLPGYLVEVHKDGTPITVTATGVRIGGPLRQGTRRMKAGRYFVYHPALDADEIELAAEGRRESMFKATMRFFGERRRHGPYELHPYLCDIEEVRRFREQPGETFEFRGTRVSPESAATAPTRAPTPTSATPPVRGSARHIVSATMGPEGQTISGSQPAGNADPVPEGARQINSFRDRNGREIGGQWVTNEGGVDGSPASVNGGQYTVQNGTQVYTAARVPGMGWRVQATETHIERSDGQWESTAEVTGNNEMLRFHPDGTVSRETREAQRDTERAEETSKDGVDVTMGSRDTSARGPHISARDSAVTVGDGSRNVATTLGSNASVDGPNVSTPTPARGPERSIGKSAGDSGLDTGRSLERPPPTSSA